MPVLDLSSLEQNNISDCFYMESLSLENLPNNGISLINDSYTSIMKKTPKIYNKYFKNQLDIFEPGAGVKLEFDSASGKVKQDTQSPIVLFQAHDMQTVKVKTVVKNDNPHIHLDAKGYSYSTYQAYNISVLFDNVKNYQCEFTKYSKGKIIERREAEFNTVFNKNNFMFREIVFGENEKLEGEITFVFISDKISRHSDLGDRKVLTLTFTPEAIEHNIVEIPYNKEKKLNLWEVNFKLKSRTKKCYCK